jgi:hypothetical protein
VLSDLHGHVLLQNGIATFTGLTFNVPSAQAQMRGVKSVLLTPFDQLFKRKPHGAIIPVQMTGIYSDLHYGLEPGLKKN